LLSSDAIAQGRMPMAESLPVNISSSGEPTSLVRRYRVLLEMADLLAHNGSLPDLFRALALRLRDVVSFDVVMFSLYHAAHDSMKITMLEQDDRGSMVEWKVESCASGWVWTNQERLTIPDLHQEHRFQATTSWLVGQAIRSLWMLPLTATEQRLGALGFASHEPSAYDCRDVEFMKSVAELVALAVNSAIARQALQQENERLQVSLEIGKTLSSSLEFSQMFPAITATLGRAVKLDYASITVLDKGAETTAMHVVDSSLNGLDASICVPADDSLSASAIREREVKLRDRAELECSRSPLGRQLTEHGIQAMCSIPLINSKRVMGALNLASRKEDAFGRGEVDLLLQIASHVAAALENAHAYQEIADLKDKLAVEKLYLEDEIRAELNFEQIVGESPNFKRTLSDAKTVAPSDATVLLLGETGTGKELLARAIHNMSRRKNNSFIKLNRAAIPTGLLESELFGHEKGAFTGAISQKIGRLELADRGTLFLDEVGDVPPELQPKLLRVLQDQEFERLGSNRTIKVSVRLIAATNRDLASLVAAREFRSDLYYRLRVFPVHLPPLRERRSDIPMLVRYFVQRLAGRMDKNIESIPVTTMDLLNSWDWPGNVRELENFLERCVILSRGPALTVPVAELKPLGETSLRRDTSLESAEREHIVRILRETGGLISGARGAASRLGLKRTTLQSKMQKLGISRQDYQS
jgi:formate hydrogenlyase transcriptional activator